MALVPTYFKKKRGLALAIVASGSATGGVIYPLMVQQLLPRVGFAWTMRLIGFVQLVLLLVAFAFFRQRLSPRKSGPIVEWSAFRETPYLLFGFGMFFISAWPVVKEYY